MQFSRVIEYREYTALPPEEVLHELLALAKSVFPNFSSDYLLERMKFVDALHIVIAFHKQAAVGFKIGYRRTVKGYYSWLGGVAAEYRRCGIASELLDRQHAWCRAQGFTGIRTVSSNQWKEMIILNLRRGFDIIGTYTDAKGCTRVVLNKKL